MHNQKTGRTRRKISKRATLDRFVTKTQQTVLLYTVFFFSKLLHVTPPGLSFCTKRPATQCHTAPRGGGFRVHVSKDSKGRARVWSGFRSEFYSVNFRYFFQIPVRQVGLLRPEAKKNVGLLERKLRWTVRPRTPRTPRAGAVQLVCIWTKRPLDPIEATKVSNKITRFGTQTLAFVYDLL